MTTTFKILFSVEVLHDFYRESICSDFRFIPDDDTSALLAGCNAMYKTVGNKLIVLIKSDEAGKPFILPKASDRFTFYMELMQPVFMTVTGVDLDALSQKRFYFTNLHQNLVTVSPGNDILYLSEEINGYDPAAPYHTGDFALHNNTIFECIKQSAGGNAPGGNSSFWMSRDKSRYASAKDLLQFVPRQFAFPVFPKKSTVQVKVFQLNLTNNLYDELVIDELQHFENDVESVSVNLTTVKEGKYRVLINGKEFSAYVSNDAVYKNMFAVIDLYNHLPNGNAFSFFDATGKLKDDFIGGRNVWLNYTIRFANRLAFWKYRAPKKGVKSIGDDPPADLFTPNADPADLFTSKSPIALREKPHEFKLNLIKAISRDPPLAPNPDINASGMLTRDGEDYYCNIYLNY